MTLQTSVYDCMLAWIVARADMLTVLTMSCAVAQRKTFVSMPQA